MLAFADARAESVGESITRLRLAQLGLPDVDLQVVLTGTSYRSMIRVDREIVGHRTVVEFDGRVKYGRFLRAGHSAGDAVFDEKRREDVIRATGRQCDRIVRDELRADRFRRPGEVRDPADPAPAFSGRFRSRRVFGLETGTGPVRGRLKVASRLLTPGGG